MKPIIYIFIGVTLGLLLAGGIWISARSPEGESVTLRPPPTFELIQVHVTGAIVRPGVYDMQENSRVLDAVEAAGGFVAEADKNAINLAAFLEDGERLQLPYVAGYVPDDDDSFAVVSEGTPSPLAGEDLVDINTASLEELDKLPGIGRTSAQNIIDYREDNGPFARKEDIVYVSGIGAATYDEIKDLIVAGSE